MKPILFILSLLISVSTFGQVPMIIGAASQNRIPSSGSTPPPGYVVTDLIDDATQGSGVNQVNYTGVWTHNGPPSTGKVGSYQTTYSFSNDEDAEASMQFSGFQVKVYFANYPTHGIAAVSIDGGAETMVDLYSTAN